jgi:hypothetical protein
MTALYAPTMIDFVCYTLASCSSKRDVVHACGGSESREGAG